MWKPNKQLTGFLRLWHVIERGKKKRAARLCARNSFPFLPKTQLIPVGYPCVGWLLLLRRRYTHRCLQIWLPPAASDWIQGWDSAPQNTTRKHKMASGTSAILGLLKNTKGLPFRFFSKDAVWRLRKSGCSSENDRESILCQALRRSQQTQTSHSLLWAQSKRATVTIFIRQLENSQRKSIITYSMFK